LRRVEIVAGDGVKGADGGLVMSDPPTQEELNGNSEAAGGGEKTCQCQGTFVTRGGSGGIPIDGGSPGSNGVPDYDPENTSNAGQGGVVAGCGSGGTGVDGATAPPTIPAAGAATHGTVGAAGWEPASGDDGENGRPGQGGGGGASRNENGQGGGGGCGGCGGNGAIKGLGGGASIALLTVDSDIVLATANLVAGNAGEGGGGSAGEAAQEEFGIGGNIESLADSCGGGNGGLGAAGGASGGGAGGISVGIVWSGDDLPDQTDVRFEIGTEGDGGIGGEPGVNDGIDGVTQTVLEVM
jgi:hypothetical protein